MACTWRITVWDQLDPVVFTKLMQEIQAKSEVFENHYSRFRTQSLVWQLSTRTGRQVVPPDFTEILRLYQEFSTLTGGKFTPLIAENLREAGYDETYRLTPKTILSSVPRLDDVIQIIDDTQVQLLKPALLDYGGLGKGFFVDAIASLLKKQGVRRFLVDGSGDLYYHGPDAIRVGLEHPSDPTQAIGTVDLTQGALCGSGSNRRKWAEYHHILDPDTHTSPQKIVASWVRAERAVLADGLATCLFLCPVAQLKTAQWPFAYCTVQPNLLCESSTNFGGNFFTSPGSSPEPKRP